MTAVQPKVYLLDVEGTTSPMSLISEQLFPYARLHLRPWLAEHAGEPELRADLTLLLEENLGETAADAPRFRSIDDIGRAGDYLLWLMSQDRKSAALKSLQGRIWKGGFDSGELIGTVFPDVRPALERWSRESKIAIYSSGSVEAQKLLFRYSSDGDLTHYIAGNFDTRMGPKTSSASYSAIARQLAIATAEIVFISDLTRELDPAREAGCQTRLSLREGNAPVPDQHGHLVIHSFAELT